MKKNKPPFIFDRIKGTDIIITDRPVTPDLVDNFWKNQVDFWKKMLDMAISDSKERHDRDQDLLHSAYLLISSYAKRNKELEDKIDAIQSNGRGESNSESGL